MDNEPNHIQEWINHLAKNFRDMEECEVMVFEDRDAVAMRFVIDCLLNPNSETAAQVLGKIVRERNRRVSEVMRPIA